MDGGHSIRVLFELFERSQGEYVTNGDRYWVDSLAGHTARSDIPELSAATDRTSQWTIHRWFVRFVVTRYMANGAVFHHIRVSLWLWRPGQLFIIAATVATIVSADIRHLLDAHADHIAGGGPITIGHNVLTVASGKYYLYVKLTDWFDVDKIHSFFLLQMHSFLGYTALTVFVSFWMSLAFESPVLVLEKFLLPKDKAVLNKTERSSKQDLIPNEAIGEAAESRPNGSTTISTIKLTTNIVWITKPDYIYLFIYRLFIL